MPGHIPLFASGSDYWKEKGLLQPYTGTPHCTLLEKATDCNSTKISATDVSCLRKRAEHKPALFCFFTLRTKLGFLLLHVSYAEKKKKQHLVTEVFSLEHFPINLYRAHKSEYIKLERLI